MRTSTYKCDECGGEFPKDDLFDWWFVSFLGGDRVFDYHEACIPARYRIHARKTEG